MVVANWRPFYRKTSRNHMLEAKIASGGESYGHSAMGYVAKNGEWLCRNPENGHTWVMSEIGMEELYRPADPNDAEWEALMLKTKPKKKKRKKGSSSDMSKKMSSSFDLRETGPLFFDTEDDK